MIPNQEERFSVKKVDFAMLSIAIGIAVAKIAKDRNLLPTIVLAEIYDHCHRRITVYPELVDEITSNHLKNEGSDLSAIIVHH